MGADEVKGASLTRRELEVAALVAQGLTNRAIAERMFISERTVDGHLEHIREKLGVSTRTQVATWYAARPPAGPAIVARQGSPRPRYQASGRVLAAAALVVLALVAVVSVPRLIAPASPTTPALTTFAGTTSTAEFNRPQSVAVASDGSIYIADSDNFAIKKINPGQRTIALVAGGHEGRFVEGSDALSASIGNPTSVAVAPDGKTIFFANGVMVGRIDLDSTVHLVASDPMQEPVGLAFAPDGSLYIADLAGNSIWVRTAAGVLSRFAGSGRYDFAGDGGPALDAALERPRGVAVDALGNVLIADTGNNRIRRVDLVSDVITTIAGSSAIYGFAGDGGPADLARLSLPWGVSVGPDGDIYIADTGNDRIRRVTPAGRITSVVGGQGVLSGPARLAISASGDLYIVDMGDSRLEFVRGLAAR
jgi:DNA-binding CsgD family transcriptional regulator/DNA-binding beta-propeller fold protein YncE